MQPDSASSNKPSKGGYGKRPLWQWIVIYVILAVIVYGVAFAIYRHYHKSTSTNGSTSTSGGLY